MTLGNKLHQFRVRYFPKTLGVTTGIVTEVKLEKESIVVYNSNHKSHHRETRTYHRPYVKFYFEGREYIKPNVFNYGNVCKIFPNDEVTIKILENGYVKICSRN